MEKFFGMKITTAKAAIAFICLLVGLVVALQIKSVVRNALDPASAQRMDVLSSDLIKEKNKSEELFRLYIECKDELEEYQRRAGEESDASDLLEKQLRKVEIMAGLADVEGPGITLKLDDSKIKDIGENANAYLIHNDDLLMAINELKNAGAEAISLNGERLIATSDVRCVGSVVTVNGHRYAPPYEIKAIGNPETLETALRMRDGVVDRLGYYGIELEIRKSSSLKIPRYSGAIEFNYATIPTSEAQ